MAKYVLVEFEDDEKADNFVYLLDMGFLPTSGDGRVRGVYKKPTLFCECPEETRDKSGRSLRGSKYGWWVKSCCGRPLKGGAQNPYNQLDKEAGILPINAQFRLVAYMEPFPSGQRRPE